MQVIKSLQLSSVVIICIAFFDGLGGCGARDAEENSRVVASEVSKSNPLQQLTATSATTRTKQARNEWHTTMLKTPLPKRKGCFHARHSGIGWEEVPCAVAPEIPLPYSPIAQTVGGTSGDFIGRLSSGTIVEAHGSFPDVVGVTSETRNDFSLQINTNTFDTTACLRADNPSACHGWQQFIAGTPTAVVMQYWLINFGATCDRCPPPPTGKKWTHQDNSCFVNSKGIDLASPLSATDLANYDLYAKTYYDPSSPFGYVDRVEVITPSDDVYVVADDSFLGLSPEWTEAEFNVFGHGGGRGINFNDHVTIRVQVDFAFSDSAPFGMRARSFTGETTNLSLIGSACSMSPGYTFVESNDPDATPQFCLPSLLPGISI